MTWIVYTLFNAAGDLLYAGMTTDLYGRLYDHGKTQPWFIDVMKVRKVEFHTEREARDAEYSIIAAENPPHNWRGKDICPRCRERLRERNRRAPYCTECRVAYVNERRDRLGLPRRKPPTTVCPKCGGEKEPGPNYCRPCKREWDRAYRANGGPKNPGV